jgi:hypothetical protein
MCFDGFTGGGLLSEAGRELLSREVGDIARGALEAQVRCCLDGNQTDCCVGSEERGDWNTVHLRLMVDYQMPCLETCTSV